MADFKEAVRLSDVAALAATEIFFAFRAAVRRQRGALNSPRLAPIRSVGEGAAQYF